MVNDKFQDRKTSDSEDDFKSYGHIWMAIYGHCDHLGHVTKTIVINSCINPSQEGST